MNITSYSRDRIREGVEKARKKHATPNEMIRTLFVPTRIDDDNFDRACDIYSRVDPTNFDTVIIIESYENELDKKLPMPSGKSFKTPLGEVPVNDFMRNEFCDEDDDFFVCDDGFSRDMSLFQQLMMLQCVYDDFSVVSVQIADEGQAIVKELAHVLEEVLASRHALLVFCCDLDNSRKKEFEKVKKLILDNNESGLLNYLNSGESMIKGTTTFVAGILVAKAWELKLTFLNGEYENYTGSLLTAYAERQKVFF